MTPAALTILPTGTVGAELQGFNLASLRAAHVDAIKQAWYRHDVLIFRGQSLTDDDSSAPRRASL